MTKHGTKSINDLLSAVAVNSSVPGSLRSTSKAGMKSCMTKEFIKHPARLSGSYVLPSYDCCRCEQMPRGQMRAAKNRELRGEPRILNPPLLSECTFATPGDCQSKVPGRHPQREEFVGMISKTVKESEGCSLTTFGFIPTRNTAGYDFVVIKQVTPNRTLTSCSSFVMSYEPQAKRLPAVAHNAAILPQMD